MLDKELTWYITAAIELGYPDCVLVKLTQCKNEAEANIIMASARKEYLK